MKSLINFLQSEKIIFIGLVLVLLALIVHTSHLFYTISPIIGDGIWKWGYALSFAIPIEIAVLIFTIWKVSNHNKPMVYAISTFMINLLFYTPWQDLPQAPMLGVGKVLASALLSYTVYSYSELFVSKINPKGFKCDHCDATFESKAQLQGHIGGKHRGLISKTR